MKSEIIYLTFSCVLLLSISCNRQHQTVDRILDDAETLVEQHPDSAFALLDSLPYALIPGKSQYYRYLLLQIQAKDKSYRDIASDTLIFGVKEYYFENKDLNKAALSAYYCGRVLQEQKKYEQALKAYLEAEDYSSQRKDDANLSGLIQSSIGMVYYKQLLQKEAITRFKQAEKYFNEANNHKNEIITFNLIGNCFLMQEERDSAFVYYRKGLALADQHGIVNEQVGIREGIGVAYREIREFSRAKAFFKEALIFPVDSLEQARLYYNLALAFEQENQNDSARYYIEQSLARLPGKKDNFLMANIYQTWSAIEEKEKNYQQALEYERKYTDYLTAILDENENKAVLEIQKKYDFQLLQNKNIRLQIEQQRIILIGLILLLGVSILAFFFYRRSKQKQKKLLEAKQLVYQLRGMAWSFNEGGKSSSRTVLLRHFDVLKKTALLEGYLKEEERIKGEHLLRTFNEIVYGEKHLDWDVVYQRMNNLQGGFFDRLRKAFPQFDELEFRICCLAYVEFTNAEIGILLKYQTNTIKVKKSAIRKKIGMETSENFCDFLDRKVKN